MHSSEAEVHEEADSNGDVHQKCLEVDPRSEFAVLVGHLGSRLKVEDGEINDQADAQEVVHFEQQTESSLFTIKHASVELD